MDELVGLNLKNKRIRFCLSPSDEWCYVVDNLEINKHLNGFVAKKQIDGATYELSVYKDVFCVYTDRFSGDRLEPYFSISNDKKVYQYMVDEIQDILMSFNYEIQKHVEQKTRWEQKRKIYISI